MLVLLALLQDAAHTAQEAGGHDGGAAGGPFSINPGLIIWTLVVFAILLVLAGATHESVIANYESGFRGAAEHRGHGWSFDPDTGEWVPAADEPWSEAELDAAMADRRPALVEWLDTFDVEAYLLDAGVDEAALQRVARLLTGDPTGPWAARRPRTTSTWLR